MASTTIKRITHVPKLETFKQDSETETWGDLYPLYAQWDNTRELKLKCDGYKVLADNVTDYKVFFYTSASAQRIEPNVDYTLDVSSVLPTGKTVKSAIICIQSYGTYYFLPYIDSGAVKTWVYGAQSPDWNKIKIKSSIEWPSCQIFATIFTD